MARQIRELENEMRRMVALADSGEFLSIKHLSEELAAIEIAVATDEFIDGQKSLFSSGATLKEIVERIEKQMVAQTLLRNRWNYSRTAQELGLSRVGLANKIKRYKLEQAFTASQSVRGG